MSIAWIIGQAEGALTNGTRVVKSIERLGDAHKIGDGGVVMSSVAVPDEVFETLEHLPGDEFFYFVAWDDLPGVPIGIRGSAITKEEP